MADESKALVPIDERQVEFYGDELTAVLAPAGPQGESQIYVPIKPISDALGLRWSGQYERIQRDEVLSDVAQLIRVTRIRPQRGNPDALCLPLKFLPGWLFGVSVGRVRAELKEKILRYQRECYDVLWEAFQEGRLTADEDFETMLDRSDPEVVQAYQMARAVVRLARNQILMEARLSGRLDAHESRLEDIEQRIGSAGTVTEEQASHISQAVKAIAYKLSQRTGRNEYGGVYSQLYSKFGITSYKLLPETKYEAAMAFLTEWWRQVADTDDVPF